MTVTVIANYTVRPEHADEVREILSVHSLASRSEPGCLEFRAHQSVEDPTQFALYEQYVSPEAFAEHRRSEHFVANIDQRVVPLLLHREWHSYGPEL